jgi:hypothetical protein
MIPNQWYAVLESDEVPRGKAVGALRMGEKLAQADYPIIAYRRRREELIGSGGKS